MLLLTVLLATTAFARSAVFTIRDLGTYPGATDVKLKGEVTLSFLETHVSMAWDLEGAEEACGSQSGEVLEAGSENRPANACGIHIHVGTDCNDVKSIGGHYYKGDKDVWADVVYETTFEDHAIGYVSHVDFGYTVSETVGYVLVLHDSTGARMTCASIQDMEIDITDVGTYPGKTSKVDITGTARLIFGEGAARIIYNLAGVEESCKTPGSAANACGIHIHEGTDCNDATHPGGHYYNSRKYKSDPWSPVVYVPTDGGKAVGAVNVGYGESWTNSIGRVLVVHDSTGARVTCANIGGKIEASAFKTYPGYGGHLKVKGDAQLFFLGSSVSILHNLSGVDSHCKEPSSASNSCGIHIHESACEDPNGAGGHYFDKKKFSSDPWSPVVYQEFFGSFSKGSENVEYGYDFEETFKAKRSLVIHDVDGARVSCVTLTSDLVLTNRMGFSVTRQRNKERRV